MNSGDDKIKGNLCNEKNRCGYSRIIAKEDFSTNLDTMVFKTVNVVQPVSSIT